MSGLWTGGAASLYKGTFQAALRKLQEESVEAFLRRGYFGRVRLVFALRREARRQAKAMVPEDACY